MPLLMSACVVVVVAMVAAINLALPALGRSDLAPTSTELLWIVDAYILVFGCLLIPAGAFGDRVGRKGVLLAGLVVFALGCLASAASPSVPALLGARVVTGVGAALVMPATLSLLLQVTEPHDRPQAIAIWSAATGAAGALGNLGGGLVLQWFPWQGLFLVAAPVALVLAGVVARVAPPGQRQATRPDPVGAGLLTAAVGALLFAIIEGPERGWSSGLVLGSFATAVALAAAFVARSLRDPEPMLDPRVFRTRTMRTGTLGVGAVFFGLFALFFVNAQYLQHVQGYSPLTTGAAILPLPLVMVVVSRRSVSLAGRYGAGRLVAFGMVLLAIGLAAFSLLTATTAYGYYAAILVVIATGMGLSVPGLSAGIVTSLPPARAGMGSGLNSAVREIGAALGIAAVGSIMASRFTQALPAELEGHTGTAAQTLRVAEELGASVQADAIGAFTQAMATGFRVVAVIVLIASAVVARSASRPA
jgi:EmrB/QacA subfamily drug resistance transporter